MEDNSTKFAYCAGIIDGEGAIGLRKTKSTIGNWCYSAYIAFWMSDESPARLFSELFGSKMLTYRDPKRDYAMFGMQIVGRKAKPILEALYPYLKIKKEKAMLALDLIKNREESPVGYIWRDGIFVGNSPVNPKSQEYREMLFRQFCSIRGIKNYVQSTR